jgi:HD superfamily phosphodiesterase
MTSRGAFELPKEILGIRIPDSDLARAAAMVAHRESPCALFNHCMRTFVLAGLFARKHGWKYDEELVFVSAALHDLGLLEKFESAETTFEKAGALYARHFVEKAGFSPDRADRVWKSIAWHAGKVPPGSIPDIALVQEGARIDVLGKPDFYDIVTPNVQTAVLEIFPRLAFKSEFKGLLASHARRQPAHACWTAQFAQEPPSQLVKDVLNSPWPE